MLNAYIYDGLRTPFGRHAGSLAKVRPDDLAAHVIKALVEKHNLAADIFDDVILGNTNQAGEDSRNIARHATLLAGLDVKTPAQTVNRLCASGLAAVIDAARAITCNEGDIFLAGGVESMSRVGLGANVPPGTGDPRPSSWDIDLPNQFEGADRIVRDRGFGREEVDRFGLWSQEKAAAAAAEGRFDREIFALDAPVFDEDGNPTGETRSVDRDQGIRSTSLEALAGLKPVLDGGTHTAGTSSQISDGSSALLIMDSDLAGSLGLRARARIVASCLVGADPYYHLDGPVQATQRLLADTGMSIADVDIFEVNEAFAGVVMSWAKVHEVPEDRINVNGGAIALGHPVGSTGTRLLTTALHELERRDASTALVSMCAGGAQASGTIIERV